MSDKNHKRLIECLPALFREDPYPEEFLKPFEDVINGFISKLAEIDRYFIAENKTHPLYQTDPEFLPWLASWVALDLDEEWDEQKKRETISRAVELYKRRGTVDGLKEYLKIYTGYMPDIIECAWPAGLQIGVASMIGGFEPDVDFASYSAEQHPTLYKDYYVVQELAPGGAEYLYNAERVQKVDVDVDNKQVSIYYTPPDDFGVVKKSHNNASITRYDGLAENRWSFTGVPRGGGASTKSEYTGDTVLIEEETDIPYRFIVDLKVSPNDMKRVGLKKVRAIIDLEKPAHTLYYLRLVPEWIDEKFRPMQIEIRSTLNIDTIVG